MARLTEAQAETLATLRDTETLRELQAVIAAMTLAERAALAEAVRAQRERVGRGCAQTMTTNRRSKLWPH